MSTTGQAPFHAHVYYNAEQRPAAAALRKRLAKTREILFAGALCDGPAGPHPISQFEVHFREADLGVVRPILEASGLTALVHPLTDDDMADHTTLADWIGAPVELDLTILDPPGVNQGLARFGKRDF